MHAFFQGRLVQDIQFAINRARITIENCCMTNQKFPTEFIRMQTINKGEFRNEIA